jgi:uncharacterized protein YjbI with pentapeptide repeats
MSRAFKTMLGLGPWRKGEELVFVIQEKGAAAFNKARSQNPQWRPDFGTADLKGVDLTDINLKAANLVKANLEGVIVDNLQLSDERARKTLARRGAIVE